MANSDSNQQPLHLIEASHLHARRERVFLILAGLFLGTLTMLNLLGISRFIVFASWSENTGWQWGTWGEISFAVAVGVLPYPMTFLCTDLISEFYGRSRANWVVFVGLILNAWVIFILWIAGMLPVIPEMDPATHLPTTDSSEYAFWVIRHLTFGAVAASMIAYMAAQFCDVYLYHFWKRLTKGKHLWLRNNGSTMVSQLVDTIAVILITHYWAGALPMSDNTSIGQQLLMYIATGYVFKLVMALLDTIPLYYAVGLLKRFLQFDPTAEHNMGTL